MALPEGVRVELIDGKIYDMAPPTTVHQVIAQQMLVQISLGVEKSNGKCVPLEIFEGKVSLDFSRIGEQLDSLFGN